jgi:hypothetical protein
VDDVIEIFCNFVSTGIYSSIYFGFKDVGILKQTYLLCLSTRESCHPNVTGPFCDLLNGTPYVYYKVCRVIDIGSAVYSQNKFIPLTKYKKQYCSL